MSRYTSTSISLMGFDFYTEIEFEVTSRGFRGTYWDPPEPPEFEILAITLQLDEPETLGAPFEASGALLDCLAQFHKIEQAVIDRIADDNDRDWPEYDEDFYREER